MLIKERIIQLIEYKKIPKEEFYVKIGMTSANFRGRAKTTPINSTAIENILSEIPDTNPEWLLTGKGSMLKSDTTNDTGCTADENSKLIRELIEKNGELRQQLGELIKENEMLKTQIEKTKIGRESKRPSRHPVYSGSDVTAEPGE